MIVTRKGTRKNALPSTPRRINFIQASRPFGLKLTLPSRLLGCVTLGISLHASTSGLHLPIKLLDFFVGEVPVCAIGLDCLGALGPRMFPNEKT